MSERFSESWINAVDAVFLVMNTSFASWHNSAINSYSCYTYGKFFLCPFLQSSPNPSLDLLEPR